MNKPHPINTPADVLRSIVEASVELLDKGYCTPCWVWTRGRLDNGYARLWLPGERKRAFAHRISYTAFVGPIPDGLAIDHLCRNPACVNPEHLEPVTCGENVRRGEHTLHNRIKTHCPAGHPYNASNTYLRPKGGRQCRTCNVAASVRYRARKAAAA